MLLRFSVDTLNECNSSPCKNGGTCKDLIGRFECTCTDKYSGKQCQVCEYNSFSMTYNDNKLLLVKENQDYNNCSNRRCLPTVYTFNHLWQIGLRGKGNRAGN